LKDAQDSTRLTALTSGAEIAVAIGIELGLDERQHRAFLVEQVLELLVELATCGIVGRRAGLGAESLDIGGGAGEPARALADQLAGQKRQVVVGVWVVRRPAGEAKVEHILKRRDLFPELGASGVVFMISAVESLSDIVLANLEKGHTRADVSRALRIIRDAGIAFRPTWVAFTPWTTLEDYLEIFEFVEREPEPPFEVEPGLEEFLKDTALSGDASAEEIEFLKQPGSSF